MRNTSSPGKADPGFAVGLVNIPHFLAADSVLPRDGALAVEGIGGDVFVRFGIPKKNHKTHECTTAFSYTFSTNPAPTCEALSGRGQQSGWTAGAP